MIHIAICDDMKEQLEQLLLLTDEFIKTYNVDAQVRCFSHPDELLRTIETEHFHVYILDIMMPMVDGLEVGREIRKRDKEAQIVFATSEPQFALESFSSNPLNYLIKPVSRALFFETMSLAFSRIKDEIGKVFVVKTAVGLRMLTYSEIVCCEYRAHMVIYKTTKDETITSVTIREPFSVVMETLLEDERFLKPHTSYVINMSRVERMTKEGFYMQGGEVVPIVQKRFPQISDLYMDYLLMKGGNMK